MGWLLVFGLGGLALEGASGFTLLPRLLREKATSRPFVPPPSSSSSSVATTGGRDHSLTGEVCSTNAVAAATVCSSRNKKRRSKAVFPLPATKATDLPSFASSGNGDKDKAEESGKEGSGDAAEEKKEVEAAVKPVVDADEKPEAAAEDKKKDVE
ncbi:unnamed protein product, partial [Ectocarpus sp. 12 AP-2014]